MVGLSEEMRLMRAARGNQNSELKDDQTHHGAEGNCCVRRDFSAGPS